MLCLSPAIARQNNLIERADRFRSAEKRANSSTRLLCCAGHLLWRPFA
jgi:hypothetical protein